MECAVIFSTSKVNSINTAENQTQTAIVALSINSRLQNIIEQMRFSRNTFWRIFLVHEIAILASNII